MACPGPCPRRSQRKPEMKGPTTMPTKSQAQAADFGALLRARIPLFYVITREEARVERHLFEGAASAKYVTRFWDCAQGVTNLQGQSAGVGSADIFETLDAIRGLAINGGERGVWVLRDLHRQLAEGLAGAREVRSLRNLARFLPTTPRESAQAIVVLTPVADIPADLAGDATVIDWPAPDREEIAEILEAAVKKAEAAVPGLRETLQNGTRD